jgi:hypothetical protein
MTSDSRHPDDLQESPERSDDPLHKMERLIEKFENRLTLNNLRLIERYIKGELRIHVRIRWQDKDFCAVYYREDCVSRREIDTHDGVWKSDASASNKGPSELLLRGDPVSNSGGEQEAMFVEVVELMQVPQGICSSLVRFGGVNCINRVLAHSLYFSRTFGFVYLGAFEDREAGESRLLGPINQSPDNIIQSTPEILNGLPGSQGDFGRDALVLTEAVHPLSRIWLQLWNDTIRVSFREGSDTVFQVTDVLFGPFDF